MEWGWPQWIVAVIWGLSLLVHASKNGDPIDSKYNAVGRIVGVAIMAFLLHKGGFW